MPPAVKRPPYFADICAALGRFRIPSHLVEDLAQDVYVIALEKWTQGGEPPRAWLLTVAYNVARNWYRCARRRPGHDELCEEQTAGDEASPESGCVEVERRAEVYDVIDGLPDVLREVFLLAEIEGVPMLEIAQMQGVSLSKVRSRLRRAREAFWKETRRRLSTGQLAAVAFVLPEAAPEVAGSPPADALQPAASGLRRVFERVGVSVVSAGVAAGVTFAVMRDRARSVPIEPDRSVLVSEVVPSPVPPVAPAEPKISPAEPTPAAPDANAAASIDADLILLERASGEHNAGNDSEALRLLKQHLELYPNSPLAATRDNLWRQVQAHLSRQSGRLATK